MTVLDELQSQRWKKQADAIRKQYAGAYFQGHPVDWTNIDQLTCAMH